MLNLEEVFEKYENESGKFDRIENPSTTRHDLFAFLLLDALLPSSNEDIVACAEHDQIWLDIDLEKFAEIATEDDIVNLMRCGVWLDAYTGSLSMFV